MIIDRRTILRSAAASAALTAVPSFTFAASSGPIELTMTTTGHPTYQNTFSYVIEEFKKRRPDTTINIQGSAREFRELTQQTIRSSLINQLPDFSVTGTNQLSVLASRGLLQPFDNLLASSEAPLGISESAANLGRIGSATYAIPIGFALPAVYFNTDLIRKAGRDPQNLPDTWDGIVDLAQAIDGVEEGTTGGFFETDQGGNFTFLALIRSFGGDMMNAGKTEITFDRAEGMKALEIIRDFGNSGQAAIDMPRDQARRAFMAGTIGVFVSSSSLMKRIQADSAATFTVNAIRFPVFEGGTLPAAGVIAVMFTDDETKQSVIAEFVREAVSPPSQKVLLDNVNFVPANQSVIVSPQNPSGLVSLSPEATKLVTDLPKLSDWFAFPGENSTEIVNVIKDHLRKVVTLQLTPEDAMTQMKTDVSALLGA